MVLVFLGGPGRNQPGPRMLHPKSYLDGLIVIGQLD